MHPHNWYSPKELAVHQARAQSNLAHLLLSEAIPLEHWAAIKGRAFKEMLAASLEVFAPGTALTALKFCEAGEASAAIDLVNNALVRLIASDPDLVAPESSREEAYAVALEWHNERASAPNSDRFAYLWANFADQSLEERRRNVYWQRRDIRARSETTQATTFPTPTPRDGAINGGLQKKAELDPGTTLPEEAT